jgi:hypothetical protein
MELLFKTFDNNEHLKDQRLLFSECFPETHGQPTETNNHYFWKFHSFPAAPTSYEYAAWEGDDMIGYYASIPYRYRLGEQTSTAGMVCDVMTGVKARGKGVFTKLGFFSTEAMQKEGLDFVIGYPIRHEVIPGHLKVKWKIAYEMPIYMRFLKTNAVLTKKKMGFAAPLANLALKCFDIVFVKSKAGKEYSVNVLDKEDFFKLADYEDFFEKWQTNICNPLLKTMDFMKWRLGAPATEYKIVTIRKNKNLVAIAITRKTVMEDIPVLAILDLMMLPGNEKCLPAIGKTLIEISKNYRAEAVVTMMSKLQAKNYYLKSLGFVTSPFKFSLIIKKLNDKIADSLLFNEANWQLMWIDSDDL